MFYARATGRFSPTSLTSAPNVGKTERRAQTPEWVKDADRDDDSPQWRPGAQACVCPTEASFPAAFSAALVRRRTTSAAFTASLARGLRLARLRTRIPSQVSGYASADSIIATSAAGSCRRASGSRPAPSQSFESSAAMLRAMDARGSMGSEHSASTMLRTVRVT
jgi:hypothetical protein